MTSRMCVSRGRSLGLAGGISDYKMAYCASARSARYALRRASIMGETSGQEFRPARDAKFLPGEARPAHAEREPLGESTGREIPVWLTQRTAAQLGGVAMGDGRSAHGKAGPDRQHISSNAQSERSRATLALRGGVDHRRSRWPRTGLWGHRGACARR
jgi:hypothetical protein